MTDDARLSMLCAALLCQAGSGHRILSVSSVKSVSLCPKPAMLAFQARYLALEAMSEAPGHGFDRPAGRGSLLFFAVIPDVFGRIPQRVYRSVSLLAALDSCMHVYLA